MSAEVNLYRQKFYRNDIQGVRALSALTIMVYHIWLAKVSGGVDVFFVISGFLIGTQILGSLGPGGSFSAVGFLSKILTRITPSALLVLLVTAALIPLFSPPSLWKFSINEFVAAALHVENLELMRQSANYLNREDPPSEFQQFWALSIQVQFFIIVAATALISQLAGGKGGGIAWFRRLVIGLLLCSFAWSVYYTQQNPAAAYFNTFTRLWEFLSGCLVAVVYPYLHKGERVNRGLASGLYYFALVALALVGLLVPATVNYPGLVSLVPVSLACILILTGSVCASSNLFARALSSPLVNKVGNASFGIYLWHWPLLIFAQHHFNSTRLGLLEGLGIMVSAVVLALLSERFYERAARTRIQSFKTPSPLLICAFSALVIGSLGLAVRQNMIASAEVYHLAQQGPGQAEIPSFDDFLYVDYDRPPAIKNCLGIVCEYGDVKAAYTVALVGDSHAAQWQPVIDHLGKAHGFKVVSILSHPTRNETLRSLHPDAVITIGARVMTPDANGPNERVMREFDTLMNLLQEMDIPAAAIRDNPRFSFRQNSCMWKNRATPEVCGLERSAVYAPDNPVLAYTANGRKLQAVDLSDLFCGATLCPAYSRGRLVYYDRHHFSHSFLKSIMEDAAREILSQAPNIFPPKTTRLSGRDRSGESG